MMLRLCFILLFAVSSSSAPTQNCVNLAPLMDRSANGQCPILTHTLTRLSPPAAPQSKTTGKAATRDLVNFSSFEQFKNAPPGRFASETLAELPDQMIAYFQAHSITPDGWGALAMHEGGDACPLPPSARGDAALAQVGRALLRDAL